MPATPGRSRPAGSGCRLSTDGLVGAGPATGAPNADPTHVEYVEDYVRIASRQSESIDVALFRDRARGDLVVVAKDKVTGEDVKIPVDGESAAEVYRHPFAYASQSIS